MKSSYLLNVFSEDKKGLVSIITSKLNRKGMELESINTARTAEPSMVIITIQLVAEAPALKTAALKSTILSKYIA